MAGPDSRRFPFIKYLTADNNTPPRRENDVLIVLIPRIVRMRGLDAGKPEANFYRRRTNITTRRASDIRSPSSSSGAAGSGRNQAPIRRLRHSRLRRLARASRSSRRPRTFKVRGYVLIRKP